MSQVLWKQLCKTYMQVEYMLMFPRRFFFSFIINMTWSFYRFTSVAYQKTMTQNECLLKLESDFSFFLKDYFCISWVQHLLFKSPVPFLKLLQFLLIVALAAILMYVERWLQSQWKFLLDAVLSLRLTELFSTSWLVALVLWLTT